MQWLEQLRPFVPDWTGLSLLVAGFVVTLLLRRWLPEGRRDRGRLTLLMLLLAPVLHLVASGLELAGVSAVGSPLHAVVLLLVLMGTAGAATFAVFDVALGRAPVPTLVRDIVQTALFAGLALGVAHSAGFEPMSVVTTSAVVTAVIGLSLQNVLTNTFAGMLLQLEGTVREGDWVQIGTRVGKVLAIRVRSTALLTEAGDTALVPNQNLMTQEVVNLSRPSPSRRGSLRVAFHHRHSPGEVRDALLPAIIGTPGIRTQPVPTCQPADFSGTTVVYLVTFWLEDLSAEAEIEGEVRERIWYASERARLEGPTPAPAAASSPSELERRLKVLGNVDLFGLLSDADRELVARAMVRRRARAGQVLVHEGETGNSLFVVEWGQVRVEVGLRQLALLGPGGFFGEMSLLTGAPRQATVVAVQETSCDEIAAPVLLPLLARHPELAQKLSAWLARRRTELGAPGRPEVPHELPAAGPASKDSLLQHIRQFFHLE
jgi:small-conductance mechanosensitive channel